DRVTGVRTDDGRTFAADAVVVGPRAMVRADFLAPLGIVPVEHPTGMGTYLAADANGLTSVPGVWVAGNSGNLGAQVIHAAAAGNLSAAMINADLVTEDTDIAMRAA